MKNKTVVVAMSGGVDSSTVCLLLKNEGYRVIGVTLKLWTPDCDSVSFTDKSCCSPDDFSDARKIASQLKIPYYVLNCEKEFKKEVIDYFTKQYFSGFTPSPCILCNQKIKFDFLLKRVLKEFKADFLATGHYAQIVYNNTGNEYELLKGHDTDKDQSYFLWGINQKIMKNILFPAGKYTKKEIRKIASDSGLIVAEKSESQEICFIPDNNYNDFLRRHKDFNFPPGLIVDINGKVLGKHKGLPFYTIGQRKGIGVSSPDPLYVINIDIKTNTIVVGNNNSLFSDTLYAREIIWCSDDYPKDPILINVKIRSRSPESEAMLYPQNNHTAKIIFTEPQMAITPGQAVVFYIKNKVIGGGWITTEG